jgi:hypothetical protein
LTIVGLTIDYWKALRIGGLGDLVIGDLVIGTVGAGKA